MHGTRGIIPVGKRILVFCFFGKLDQLELNSKLNTLDTALEWETQDETSLSSQNKLSSIFIDINGNYSKPN